MVSRICNQNEFFHQRKSYSRDFADLEKNEDAVSLASIDNKKMNSKLVVYKVSACKSCMTCPLVTIKNVPTELSEKLVLLEEDKSH